MIAGILKPTGGSISIAGVDLASDPIGAKMKLGFIPDRPFIYEKLTGSEFLRFVAGLYEQEGPDVEHRARELMALFDLEEWRDELVESYSHGMRQKLIISSAFVHRPDVIVVDEPMVGLDPKAAKNPEDPAGEYAAPRSSGTTIMMRQRTRCQWFRGDVRPRGDHCAGYDPRGRHDGRAARERVERGRAGADIPATHRRECGARTGGRVECLTREGGPIRHWDSCCFPSG